MTPFECFFIATMFIVGAMLRSMAIAQASQAGEEFQNINVTGVITTLGVYAFLIAGIVKLFV